MNDCDMPDIDKVDYDDSALILVITVSVSLILYFVSKLFY